MKKPVTTGASRNKKGQFVKGQSGNPSGRTPGTFSLVSILKHELQRVPKGQHIDYATAYIRKLLHKAIVEGDNHAQRLVINYIEGLPKQPVEHSGDMGLPYTIVIQKDDRGSTKTKSS